LQKLQSEEWIFLTLENEFDLTSLYHRRELFERYELDVTAEAVRRVIAATGVFVEASRQILRAPDIVSSGCSTEDINPGRE
jgi:hypothetical protein